MFYFSLRMSKLREVVIVSACRTPIGAYGGSLNPIHGVQLGAAVMKEAIKRAKIDPAIIGDVRMGSCNEHYDAMNVARVSALLAGFWLLDATQNF